MTEKSHVDAIQYILSGYFYIKLLHLWSRNFVKEQKFYYSQNNKRSFVKSTKLNNRNINIDANAEMDVSTFAMGLTTDKEI